MVGRLVRDCDRSIRCSARSDVVVRGPPLGRNGRITLRVCAFAAFSVLVISPPTFSQTSTPALDLARQQPIVEGEEAAGIRLGDREDAVITTLGGQPDRTELVNGGQHLLVYVSADAASGWSVTIRVLMAGDDPQVQAVGLLIIRRDATSPDGGRTNRGYRPGDCAEWVRALYGTPDSVVTESSERPELWWYREAGIIIAPAWRAGGQGYETRIAVINPHLMLLDVSSVVLEP